MVVVDHTYEIIYGMKIPYLTYWNYAKINVALDNNMKSFKVM